VVCSGFDIKFINDGPNGVGLSKLMQVRGGRCTVHYCTLLYTTIHAPLAAVT